MQSEGGTYGEPMNALLRFGLIVSLLVAPSAAGVETRSSATVQHPVDYTTNAGATVYDFYHDYFNSKSSCDARGYALKNYEHMRNMSGWTCVRHPGDSKWSMHVHYGYGGIE